LAAIDRAVAEEPPPWVNPKVMRTIAGIKAPDPPHPESRQRDLRGAAELRDEQPRDQVTGEDEGEVNAEKPTACVAEVVGDHGAHRQRTQPVERGR
jgi:hypothetical protein